MSTFVLADPFELTDEQRELGLSWCRVCWRPELEHSAGSDTCPDRIAFPRQEGPTMGVLAAERVEFERGLPSGRPCVVCGAELRRGEGNYVCVGCTWQHAEMPLGRAGYSLSFYEIEHLNRLPRPVPRGILAMIRAGVEIAEKFREKFGAQTTWDGEPLYWQGDDGR